MRVQIPLTEPQKAFFRSKAPYPAFVGGFGSGKTDGLITRMVIRKLMYPSCDFAFYEPTWDLVRMIAWARFEEKLTLLGIPYRLKKNPDNLIEIEGHGRIIFRSMEVPQRIIGYEVAESGVDELDTLKRDDAAYVWRQILARNRQKKPDRMPNQAAVATTPEGFRFVYEAWEADPQPGYEIIRAPTYSNPYLPDGYIESLRSIYPANLLDAYIEGRFVNLTTGTVYTGFDRKRNGTNIVQESDEPLFIGMDFNVGNMSAVIHVKRDSKPIAVSEITKAYDTPDICKVIRSRHPSNPIYVYPDASGGSRRSNDAAVSDLRILREAGFNVMAPKKNPPVRDRVNAMNAAFANGYQVNIDRCPMYVRCLEQQAYNNNGEPDKAQGLDHLPDGGGYFIHYEFPLVKPAMNINLKMAH